jgi:hypothetical protein
MLNTDQRHYLEEVLGLNSAGMVLTNDNTPPSLPSHQHHALLVLTYPLNPEERALLDKILGSVQLGPYAHIEAQEISLAECPSEHTSTYVLAFANYPTGIHIFDEGQWLVLPPLSSMTGANADVVVRKKETWNLLQQFVRERK